MAAHEKWELKQMQSLPLEAKIQMTRQRVRGWVEEFGEDGVYISFSGGKDSTVLMDIIRKDFPDIEAVFVNTGLEYPSVRIFAQSKENVITLRPEMNFKEVIRKYGYPLISKEVSQTIWEAKKSVKGATGKYTYRLKKLNGTATDKDGKPSQYNIPQWKFLLNAPFDISHKCCDVMKKKPSKEYEKEYNKTPIIGTMAEESKLRLTKWLRHGCNAFDLKRPSSQPLSFWTENDILEYIHKYGLQIAEAYGEVVVKEKIPGQMTIWEVTGNFEGCEFMTTKCKRTGCIFCGFGITQDKGRFIELEKQEPVLCDYVMRGGEFNKTGTWQPSNEGLGYWFVLEWLNTHGNLNIRIPSRNHYLEKYQTEKTKKYLIV